MLSKLAGRAAARAARPPTTAFRRSSQQKLQREAAQQQVQVVMPSTSVVPGRSVGSPAYENADGLRIDDGRYTRFKQDMRQVLGTDRVVDDPVRTFAFGTDASFYRLNPQVVVKVRSEAEVLLFPGTKLEVVGVAAMAPGLYQVHLKEMTVPVQLIK